MSKRDRDRRQRRSTARRRAEQRGSGYSTTCLKIPDGMSFFQYDVGVKKVAIVEYQVGDGNPYFDKGETHYERTYWRYNRIGAAGKNYVCPSETFGHPDPIKEYRDANASRLDEKTYKSLLPKERQLFLVYDYADAGKGLQLWEFSFHQFGKLLDDRIRNSLEEEGWEDFYFADEDGMDLRLTFSKTDGFGLEVSAIDFIPRQSPLPDVCQNHGFCLDDMLIETPYDRLKSIFLQEPDADRPERSQGSEEAPEEAPPAQARSRRPASTTTTASKPTTTQESSEPTPKRSSASVKKDTDPSHPSNSRSGVKRDSKPPTDVRTAEEAGISRGDDVEYDGMICTVASISPDGSSLKLLDPEDNLITAIGVDDVKTLGDAPPPAKRESHDDQPQVEDPPFDDAVPSGDVSEDWDSDW